MLHICNHCSYAQAGEGFRLLYYRESPEISGFEHIIDVVIMFDKVCQTIMIMIRNLHGKITLSLAVSFATTHIPPRRARSARRNLPSRRLCRCAPPPPLRTVSTLRNNSGVALSMALTFWLRARRLRAERDCWLWAVYVTFPRPS